MSAPSKVNKENFRLLDLSSEEESEDLQLEIIPSRKKKITRRERSRGPTIQAQEPSIGTEVQCALRWAVRGTLLLWLLMLTWICAALYDQVSIMRTDMNQGESELMNSYIYHQPYSKETYSDNYVYNQSFLCIVVERQMRERKKMIYSIKHSIQNI